MSTVETEDLAHTEPASTDGHSHRLPSLELVSSELVTVTASCGATQHSFYEGDASTIEGARKPYLYCQQCGETRKVEVPS